MVPHPAPRTLRTAGPEDCLFLHGAGGASNRQFYLDIGLNVTRHTLHFLGLARRAYQQGQRQRPAIIGGLVKVGVPAAAVVYAIATTTTACTAARIV